MKVFVSSTARELPEYRDAAKEALTRLGHQVIMMEQFPASGDTPRDYCRKQVEKCDLFVGILGVCYGSIPKGESVSFTELEYQAAQAANRTCLMFLSSGDYAVRASAIKGETRLHKQEQFRDNVSKKKMPTFFSTPEDLKYKIADSIRKHEASGKPWQATPVDCVVLVGGTASRLWPLTKLVCKELLPVGGKPVLGYTIDALKRCKLVSSITVLTGRAFAGQIRSFLKSRSYGKVNVQIEPVASDGKRQGPLGALKSVLPRLRKDLLVLGGDNLFSFRFEDFVEFAQRRGHSANAFFSFETGHDQSEYGVGDLAPDDRITRFQEKQRIPSQINISTACYVFRQEELRLLDEYEAIGGDRCSLGSFVAWLVKKGIHVDGFRTKSDWFDIGTRLKYLEASRKHLTDRVEGQVDQTSRRNLKGPVQIEQGAKVSNCSRIGPNVYIGAGVVVEESTLEDCVVLDKAQVSRCSMRGSIIAPRSRVEGNVFDCIVGEGSHLLGEGLAPLTEFGADQEAEAIRRPQKKAQMSKGTKRVRR